MDAKETALLLGLALCCSLSMAQNQKLLVIFIDGFRHDYFARFSDSELSGFNSFHDNGVKADFLEPIFPTRTNPNSYTILTGLYPNFHGIVHNYMWDPLLDKDFLNGRNYPESQQPYWWDGGEPIWNTVQKQNKKAYVWYWFGCEVELGGYKPDYCASYQSNPNPSMEDFTSSLWEAVDVLKKDNAHFAAVYYEAIDYFGHREGPNGDNVNKNIRDLDALLKELDDKLSDDSNLKDKLNVIIVSDHGMTDIHSQGQINLLNYIKQEDVKKSLGANADSVVMLWPADNSKESTIYNALKSVDNLNVYKRSSIPDRYQIKRHFRTAPLVVEAKEGYVILELGATADTQKGTHGYDYENPSMRGIFLARGPAFKSKGSVDGFSTIEVYNMMCHVLDLDPAPNNGQFQNVCDMMEGACVGGTGSVKPSTLLSMLLLLLLTLIKFF